MLDMNSQSDLASFRMVDSKIVTPAPLCPGHTATRTTHSIQQCTHTLEKHCQGFSLAIRVFTLTCSAPWELSLSASFLVIHCCILSSLKNSWRLQRESAGRRGRFWSCETEADGLSSLHVLLMIFSILWDLLRFNQVASLLNDQADGFLLYLSVSCSACVCLFRYTLGTILSPEVN